MKKLLYFLIVCVCLSTVFLIIDTYNKNTSNTVNSCDESVYSLGEFCLDLKSEDYDFSVYNYSHSLFLSKTSKKIKIDTDYVLVYIYPNMEAMNSDVSVFINHQHELRGLFENSASLFYKKDRLIVQYSGNNENIKKSLESILGLSFLQFS